MTRALLVMYAYLFAMSEVFMTALVGCGIGELASWDWKLRSG